jgi:TRAP-type C4-dicarboxylate transport system substrate-binding protein
LGADARAVLERLAIAYERESTAALKALESTEDAELRARGVEVITLSEEAGRAYRKAAFETAWERMRSRDATGHDALREKFYREE